MAFAIVHKGLVAVLLLALIVRSGAEDNPPDTIPDADIQHYDEEPDLGDHEAARAAHDEWWADAPETVGYSADGHWFDTTDEAWTHVLAGRSKEEWYQQVTHYWNQQDADSNSGVLQGFNQLHEPDVRDSISLINHTFTELHGPDYLEKHGKDLTVLEVGAGIGRVTRSVLLPLFGNVEVLEPAKTMLDKAKILIAGDADQFKGHSVTAYYENSVHDFDFGEAKYDVIWVQWVLVYLVEDDFDNVLDDIARSLKPGGVVFIKENVAGKGFVMDTHSNGGSLTRSAYLMEEAFTQAGFEIKYEMIQSDFGEDIYDVHMWALTLGTDESGEREGELGEEDPGQGEHHEL